MYAVGKKFSVADGVISSYEHPPVVELGEVKRSPVKKRVSITASSCSEKLQRPDKAGPDEELAITVPGPSTSKDYTSPHDRPNGQSNNRVRISKKDIPNYPWTTEATQQVTWLQEGKCDLQACRGNA